MEDLLSYCKIVGQDNFTPKSNNNLQSYTASQVVEVAKIYSASVLDNTEINCFLEHHAMVAKPSEKHHPVVLLLLSGEPPQSLSVKPERHNTLVCLYRRL